MTDRILTLSANGQQLVCKAGHRNLLEVFEHHQVEVEYQCREGYCGSCRMKLISGEVTYSEKPLAFISDGEILPCCCMPDGDIEVEF
ncbi:class I ribonucleotide reductase maintenance protein YfaE [Rahnella perminowiae]|uniref:class I ribonucleotide reductase maintenance protein YfaE n=1 Tax=Rahnella perminowiae TaxID=2816244 RepID=UPI00224A991C|nr:class I ribonucleotide reductase maintenance protein YfaE [Rahnella perminowiae]MCX2941755.1 class I ribonucleotide reductase maintenance protein YfaE [Rahnella perminowiae]